MLKLKEYASLNKVPIIKDEGLVFLLSSIKKYDIKNVLEVGTAIGYSAINMALNGCSVTTLERDDNMYNLAIENVKRFNLESSISIVKTDALNYIPNNSFDLIFIDAAKAQNEKFFLRFTPYLKKGGLVIVDNLDFHGLVNQDESKLSRNLRQLIKKIKSFIEFLNNNKDYETTFYHLGDGMSISIKL